MPDTAVMAMSSPDDPFRTRPRITDSLMRHAHHDRSLLHVHFDAISPLGTEYPKTPLFAMAAGRELGAASSWPFGRAVVGLQDEAPMLQAGASALKTPPIKKEPLKELEKLGMVANCKKPSSPEEDLNDRLRRAAAFLGDQDHSHVPNFEERLVEIDSLLETAFREEQVDRRLVDRVLDMVATARGLMGNEDPMQLDESSVQNSKEQEPHENVEFTLPIRINVDNLQATSREATAGGSKEGKAPNGGHSGGSHGRSSGVPGRSGPGRAGGLAGGSGGTGGDDGNDGNGNRPRPDALHRADEEDDGGDDEDEDNEDALHEVIEGSQREAPWNENWYADQRPAFDDGETIFAHNLLSAQMDHDILRDEEGKRPKLPEPETLHYKSQFKLPNVKQKMAEDDDWISSQGTWSLDHLHAGEGSDPSKGVMDNFPLHRDCE
ncbi:hypothetical protein IWX49DRAFT_593136 [Phyllosticta citricarpa]|uniref:Uncharacterized protein n=2 Tax=Phyllosticta TaxID=121621 RepID=A0ABR1MEU5_9PEZI